MAADGPNLSVEVAQTNDDANTHYNAVNGSYYTCVADNLSWTEARTAAAAVPGPMFQEGHLASITSEQENTFISDYVNAQSIWIGATDEVVEGEWRWVDGPEDGHLLASGYTSWAVGEPNNASSLELYAVTNWGSTVGRGTTCP